MSFVSKLRLKEQELYLLQVPEDILSYFSGFETKQKIPSRATIGQIILFAENKAVLAKWFPLLIDKLMPDALLWIAYPKKSGNIKTDISRDNGWDVVLGYGYDPVMQIAVDENWSALRFRHSALIGPKLRDVPMSERKTEGIDYVKKTVQLPADVDEMLEQYEGLRLFFYGMSYSHKKEYAEAIAEAKKPETRQRRIEKMIEKLQLMNAEKNKK